MGAVGGVWAVSMRLSQQGPCEQTGGCLGLALRRVSFQVPKQRLSEGP